MKQKALAFYLILVGIVLFNNWALGFLLNSHLLTSGGSISELSAKTQSYNQVFRVLDVLAGIFLAAGFLISAKKYKDGLARRVSFAGLLLGIANIFDALLPLPCSGTLDHACNSPVRINWQRISFPDHAFSSTVIGALFVFIPLVVLIHAKHGSYKKLTTLAWASLVSVCFFFLTLSTANNFLDSLTGYAQELQMIVFSWLLIEVVLFFQKPQDL